MSQQLQRGDLVGFLTGVPSEPVRPRVQYSGFGAGMLNQMQSNVDNMRQAGYGIRGQDTPQALQAKVLANFDTVTPAEQKQIIAKLQTMGQTGLAQQLASRAQATARSQQEQDKRTAFSTYLSQKYPNSGLDVLATEGVVTPANFKDFLAEKQGANARQGKRYTIRDEEGNYICRYY